MVRRDPDAFTEIIKGLIEIDGNQTGIWTPSGHTNLDSACNCTLLFNQNNYMAKWLWSSIVPRQFSTLQSWDTSNQCHHKSLLLTAVRCIIQHPLPPSQIPPAKTSAAIPSSIATSPMSPISSVYFATARGQTGSSPSPFSKPPSSSTILVIGGGPAGSYTATLLARGAYLPPFAISRC